VASSNNDDIEQFLSGDHAGLLSRGAETRKK
jgi:hypothetical protein